MGLGKTVEVLACILLHQKPESHQADDLKTFITLNKASSSDAPSSVGDEEDICYFSSRVKQKKYFECICGSEEGSYGCDRANNMKIQCEKCGVWQHAECVKYDPENQLQSSYYCPHCWTTMVCIGVFHVIFIVRYLNVCHLGVSIESDAYCCTIYNRLSVVRRNSTSYTCKRLESSGLSWCSY